MDTRADRSRGRLADAEQVLAEDARKRGNHPQGQHYQPRGGFLQQRGGFRGQRDLREVVCYNCNRKGHMSRNCQQRSWGPPQASSSRVIVVDEDVEMTSEPPEYIQNSRSNKTPQQAATDWLTGVAGESDEAKELILKGLLQREDFRSA